MLVVGLIFVAREDIQFELFILHFKSEFMKIKITLALCFWTVIVAAQEYKGASAKAIIAHANQINYNDRTNFPSFLQFDSNNKVKINTQNLNWTKGLIQLNEKESLILKAQNQENLNGKEIKHFVYQQTYNEIPIENAILKFHQNESNVYLMNGDFNVNVQIENSITINKEQALVKAKIAVPAELYQWEQTSKLKSIKFQSNSFQPKPELVILPIGDKANRKFYYAYKINIYAAKPLAIYDVYIDANNGSVLTKINKLCTSNVNGTAVTKYHGTHSITTDSTAVNLFKLRQTNRKNTGVNITALNCQTGDESSAIDFTDSDNIWNNVNASMDEAATDAYFAAEQTFEYYKDIHNRNSVNDFGSEMLMYLHYDVGYFNAFWNGSYTVYGDGSGQPLTSIDVVGHEFTHGVTQYTADLIYASESGALNESFSDIFGSAIEIFALGANASWNIGRGNFTLRDMANPNRFQNPDTYGGLYWTDTKNCIPNDVNDGCGVHNNSGVQNFWFYLLSEGGTGTNDIGKAYQVTGIGPEKAAKIAYRNLSVYLTPSSDYDDARRGAIQSALDLYGFGSVEYIATTNAWYAVGVGKMFTALPIADFSMESLVCSPNSNIQFINSSGTAQSYLWSFGDGQTSTLEEPTHSYSAVGNYTVRLIATNANGSDTVEKENLISVFNSQPKSNSCIANVLTPLSTSSIYNVSFSTINNPSTHAVGEGGLVDFTCKRAMVELSRSYPITITTNTSGSVFTRVYIDYNNNGNFEIGEEVFKTDATIKTHTGNIIIPNNATINVPLRMRIRTGRTSGNTPDDPCSDIKFGQIEDYSVFISPFSGIHQTTFNSLTMYPNPAKNILYFNNENIEKYEVSIVNILGDEILKKNISESKESILIENFSKGIYLVKISKGDQTEFRKLIVE